MEPGLFARANGVRVLALGSVDSTNDEARRLIGEGERGPLWVVADRQTGGRGRLGRSWVSAPGNLYASLIVSDFHDPAVAPQLGFVAGVAAMQALRRCSGDGDFALKWPNDLLLGGAKLGGILLETVSAPTGDLRAPVAPVAIIGIGVNCTTAPPDLPYRAAALSSLGAAAPSREAFFAALSDALTEMLALWRSPGGFARVRELWLRDAAGLGAHIAVRLMQGMIAGVFETIDATGRLVLVTPTGARAIEAGDVEIGPRALEKDSSHDRA